MEESSNEDLRQGVLIAGILQTFKYCVLRLMLQAVMLFSRVLWLRLKTLDEYINICILLTLIFYQKVSVINLTLTVWYFPSIFFKLTRYVLIQNFIEIIHKKPYLPLKQPFSTCGKLTIFFGTVIRCIALTHLSQDSHR